MFSEKENSVRNLSLKYGFTWLLQNSFQSIFAQKHEIPLIGNFLNLIPIVDINQLTGSIYSNVYHYYILFQNHPNFLSQKY